MADEQKENLEEKEPEAPDELSKCQKERDEYLDGWKRARADLANYKKDEMKRLESVVKFANEALIIELIKVLDSFDLAIVALASQTNTDDTPTGTEKNPHESVPSPFESAKNQKGLFLIRQQLEDALRQNGLERIIIGVGQSFDPALEEAVAQVESDKPAGTVIEEIEKGYLLNGKLIRPVRVKVAK